MSPGHGDLRVAGDGQVRADQDPPARSRLAPVAVGHRPGYRRRLHPGRPQHRAGVVPGRRAGGVADLHARRVDLGHDRFHVQFDTQLAQRGGRLAGQLRAERGQRGAARRRAAAPGRPAGVMCRYSSRSVLVASSRIWPASSTPVGPAPTRANVSQCVLSAWLVARLGHLERAEHPAPDGQRVRDRLHPGRERGELVVPEVGLAHPGGDDQVVVAELDGSPSGRRAAHLRAAGSMPSHLGQHALDVLVPLEHLAQRGGDLPLGQDAGGALVEQRLEQVVLGAVDEGDGDGPGAAPGPRTARRSRRRR